jgi:hypothetical protein
MFWFPMNRTVLIKEIINTSENPVVARKDALSLMSFVPKITWFWTQLTSLTI